MFDTYAKLLDLLTPRERRRFFLLFAMMIVSGVVEMVTIASIFPFLAIVSDPSVVQSNAVLSRIYGLMGFEDVNTFLIFAGLGAFLLIVFGLMFSTVTQFAIYRFTALRNYSISSRLLAAYLRQPYAWFLSQNSANIGATVLSEINDVTLRGMLQGLLFLTHAVVTILLIGLLVAANPAAAVVAALLTAGSYVLVYLTVRQYITRMGVQLQESNHGKYKIASEAVGGIKDVKMLGLEEAFLQRYQAPARLHAVSLASVGVVGEIPRNTLRAVAIGGLLFFIVFMLVRGDGSLGALLPILGLYAFAGLRLLPALQNMYYALAEMRFVKPILTKVHADIMAYAPTDAPPPPDVPAVRLRARLALSDVHYAYPTAERGALDGLSLAIDAHTSVGVVGGTGAGKTTAVDVILGLLRPQRGALVVDGVPVTDASVRGWQKSVGYVPQHIFLTDDTVTANIAFGVDPAEADMAAVERAARIAELHDFVVNELPNGYDTTLGERGVRLSGGQRQRIGIARALYHDPDVLVLDEATSALDNLTEKAVMDAVHNLGRDKTIIMIAHRLSTVRDCDRIFMLERGRVVAEGSYDELVESNAEFRKLVSGGRG